MPSTFHSFKSKTFYRPIYCQCCSKLLWGLKQQGVQCSGCNYVAHYQCQNHVSAECHAIQEQVPRKKTVAEESLLLNIQHSQYNQNISASRATQSFSEQKEHCTRSLSKNNHYTTNATMTQQLLNLLQETIVSAAIDASDSHMSHQPVSQYLVNQPPLHPHTTAKNFTKFVARCSVVFNLRDAVILLICWEKPVNTWISILIYTMLCIYPKLLLLAPQSILLFLILSRTRYCSDTTKQKNISKIKGSQQKKTSISPSSPSSSKSNSGFSSTTLFTSFLTNTGDGIEVATPEYKNNLKNIQNMMGEFAQAHDQVNYYFNEYIISNNTSDSEKGENSQETLIIQGILISIISTTIVIWYLPLNWIILLTGWSIFAMNTRFAKSLWTRILVLMNDNQQDDQYILKDILYDTFATNVKNPFEVWYKKQDKEEAQANFRVLSIYENQQREQNDNKTVFTKDKVIPWSNLYGLPQKSPNQQKDPPKGHRWKSEDWVLDKTGPWIDDFLQLEIAVRPSNNQDNEEEQGWIYMDENWGSPKQRPSEQSTTRRRRWIREYELKIELSEENQVHI
ncbi:integral peroxisomal membrane peroxin-domain-containing protein [Phascolomyces articulosus]|uniref:Integral peroxisomal membrane peroxin-domain-containing protein n=1 Tax=Phascolomyces articulosus TaxID=60185 RepID=A0AAD5JTK3_9FUNG|nr:integral peroxisomal membrane peroxin-domain-containing protein [Phascolomyces articulosus]